MDDDARLARRPRRADGARNYDAILVAARAAFETSGASTSLEDIASEAGVAIGTLYRHFPTRASLVEATTRSGLDRLVESAEALSRELAPSDALQEWLRLAVRHTSTFRGLVGILAESMYEPGTPTHVACESMHRCGATLLHRAQADGGVRADVSPDELFDLISGAGWVRENHPGDGDAPADRFLHHVLSGIVERRPTAPAAAVIDDPSR